MQIETRWTMLPPPPGPEHTDWEERWRYLFETYTPAMRRYVAALLRGLKKTDPYWRCVLEYSAEGGLQSVLDEYIHILKDSQGLIGWEPEVMCPQLATAIQQALTVRFLIVHVAP